MLLMDYTFLNCLEHHVFCIDYNTIRIKYVRKEKRKKKLLVERKVHRLHLNRIDVTFYSALHSFCRSLLFPLCLFQWQNAHLVFLKIFFLWYCFFLSFCNIWENLCFIHRVFCMHLLFLRAFVVWMCMKNLILTNDSKMILKDINYFRAGIFFLKMLIYFTFEHQFKLRMSFWKQISSYFNVSPLKFWMVYI